MPNITLKLSKRPAEDAKEIEHRVPYEPRPWSGAGNMPGPKNVQRIAREHNGGHPQKSPEPPLEDSGSGAEVDLGGNKR